jgi:hypothetical protein
MKVSKLFVLQCLLFFSFLSIAQSKAHVIEIKKQYHYTFTGILSSTAKQNMEENLSSLKFVDSAKIKYKNESQNGEIFVQTTELTITSEEDKGFDIIALKKLISSFNLTPLELNVTQ